MSPPDRGAEPTLPSLAAESGAPLRAVATAFLRTRPLIVAPVAVLAAALMLTSPVPPTQRSAIALTFVLGLAFFTWEALRGRRRLVGPRWFLGSMLATLTVLGIGCAVSGGLRSPMLPMLLAPTGIACAAFGRARSSLVTLAYLALVVLALACAPVLAPLPARAHVGILAAALLDAGVLLWVGVSALTAAYARAGAALARAGEAVAESARARSLELEALGAQVAHEIKNPLAAIKGLTELLGERETDERARRRLEVVRGEVERIDGIVRDYLAFARPLESFAPARVAVDRIVADTIALLEPRAAEAGVTLGSDGPALTASLDARRIKEALLNLVLNAIEATRPGGRVAVDWAAEERGVRISVTDTGAGMDAATLSRLGDAAFTTRPDGTGLGVRLARRVAERHGGTLSYESAPGRGTTATLRLPSN